MIFAKLGWNRPSGSREHFFKIVKVYSLFRNYFPLEKRGVIQFPLFSFKDDLCWVLLKFAKWFWRRRFFKFANVFSAFEQTWISKDTLCLVWLKLAQRFSQFRYYLPLGKGGAIHLKKRLAFHSANDTLCQVWLKLTQFVNVFSLIRNYILLEKDGTLHLNKLEFFSSKNALCQFGWNCPSGSGEANENVES